MIEKFIASAVGKAILIGVAIALVALLLLMSTCNRAATEQTRADIAAGQAGSTAASGRDAVQSFSNTVATDATVDKVTTENRNAIDNSTDAVVPADLRAAGLQSLCRRTRYRDAHPACVQHPPAR